MDQQKQNVGAAGEAYQAGGDLIINKGIGPEYMAEIMISLGQQLQSYFREAEAKAESRMKELREALIAEFMKPSTDGLKEAFSDPDFQYVLREAHQFYARSGEARLCAELVSLLVQRSAKPSNSRTALILNQAIQVAGRLTPEDLAALCGIFVLKHCKIGARTSDDLFERIRGTTQPFVKDVPSDNFAYDYLESLSLITVSRPFVTSFSSVLHENYSELLMHDFSIEELLECISDTLTLQNIISILSISAVSFNEPVRFRFKTSKVERLQSDLDSKNIDREVQSYVLTIFGKCQVPEQEVERRLVDNILELKQLRELWNTTDLQRATLTALGKALAHSALVSQSGFDGSLNLWIR